MKSAENATVAKARAIYGKRLKENDYAELISQKKVTDAAEYLKKNTYFSEVLSNVDTSTVHRGFLESMLNKAYFDSYEKLCGFQNLYKQPFYSYVRVRAEVRELLRAILYLNNENKDVYIESVHAYMLEKLSLDLMGIAKADDFKSLLNVLRHTPYYDVLKNIRADKFGNIPYTQCEVLLRTHYRKWLLEQTDKCVDGNSGKDLKDLIITRTEIINIINAYRMKKYFNADAETVRKNMLPFYGKLSRDRLEQLYQTGSPEEFLRALSHTSYGRKMEQLSEDMDSWQLERELTKIVCRKARRSLMFSQNAAVSIFSLLYLEEVEINNIINIIECIRYNKSVSYIENTIVLM